MKDFFRLLKRFAFPYKWNIILSLVFNLLTAVLTIFSFAVIMPILRMLFGITTQHYELMSIGDKSLEDVAANNFYYYTLRG